MRLKKRVIKIQAIVYKFNYIKFLCVQREGGNTTALKLGMCFFLQTERAISFHSNQWIFASREDQDYSDGKATSWKQQHAKERSRLPLLTAALGHLGCEPPSSSCASEIILLKSVKLKSSKWDQNGMLKSTNSTKMSYIRTVFILAHGIQKCNLTSRRKTTKYRIWLIYLRKSDVFLALSRGSRWGESILARQKEHRTPEMAVCPHEHRDVF